MGYSQSELAEDICTQGTISNIENAITLPSTYILKEIANKLNIDIVDLVFIDDDPVEKILGKVSKLTAIGEHEKAYYELVNCIKVKDIKKNSLTKKYYYYLGITSFLGLGDIKKAESIFNNLLNEFSMGGDVEDILIFVGMGIIKIENNKIYEARELFDKCVFLLRDETLFVENNIKEILKIYYNIAKFYARIFEYGTALNLCNEGIDWANKLDSSYHYAYLLYEKGYVLRKIERYKEGDKFYNLALMYTITHKHDLLQKTILEDAEEYGIKLVDILD